MNTRTSPRLLPGIALTLVKEAQAQYEHNGQEGTAEFLHGYQLAQRDFLEQHVARWVPKFT